MTMFSPYTRFHGMAATDEQSTYFRKGFGLKADVQGDLSADYNGRIVDMLREHDYTLTVEDVTIRLASEFGFCYGVERAVEYAYQTRRKFPDRRLLLVGEIIHNPHVNAKLRSMGIEILVPDPDGTFDFSAVHAEDVVILPAFGSRISIPMPRSLALTCGLWMISPTSSSRRSGNFRRV